MYHTALMLYQKLRPHVGIEELGPRLAGVLIVLVNFFQVRKYTPDPRSRAQGDHADEMETSLLLHLCPELVDMTKPGTGERVPFAIPGFDQPGVWTPRPWSKSHPDTGSGDPTYATAEKGKQHFDEVCGAIADVIVGLSNAQRGQMPYV